MTNDESTYTIDCDEVVHTIEFSPYEWSSQLIAIGTDYTVTITACRFQEESKEVEDFEYSQLRQFHHGTRVTALSWSPATSLSIVPKLVRFVTAGADHKLRIFSSDLKDDDSVKLLEGHTCYVNGVTFDPDKGNQIASVGDDQTCRVWGEDGVQTVCFPLGSPGMGVCWHHEEPMKILVAQKNGIVRIYSLHNQQPIMSLDCGTSPLMAVDWCYHNCLAVGVVTGPDWFIFDTSRSSRPIESHQAHAEGCRSFRWSKSSENLIASTGRPGCQLKVFNLRNQKVAVNKTLQISNGLSWHFRLPVVAVGGDKKVHLWFVETS
ncbi:nucleoporin Nup37-like [Liolophura sinensis]|uniref:nucleoporin Nup37-like n=1 Tax=Liolophura sinensis TaxID=3198878 RepID=UPI0031591838